MRHQGHTGGLQLAERVEQVQKGAAKPIKCPGHHHVEPPSRGIFQQRVQARPLVAPVGAGDAVVGVDVHHLPAALLAYRF